MMDSPRIERRGAALEVRAAGRTLQGYASVYGEKTQIADFTEVVERGAFTESLRSKRDVLGLVDHDPHKLLARTKSGTLRLEEDSHGLAFTISLPATQLANDMLALVERGDVGGASFSFYTPRNGDRWEGRDRTLLKVELVDISVVTAFPAYAGTSVSARDLQPRVLSLALAKRRLELMR